MLEMTQIQEYETVTNDISRPSRFDEHAMIEQHTKLVNRVVNQLSIHANTYFSIDDMRQIGLIGLLEAGRRFGDPTDPQFPSYAVCRIRGAILDELRRLDWRSRKTRQDAHELKDATRELMRKLGRAPKDSEIIHALGIEPQDYYDRLHANLAEEMQSLDQLLENGGDDVLGESQDGNNHEQLRMTLEKALHRLDKREQLILTLFYQHDLNLHEIALVLDLTPPRICQLHKHALQKLNQFLSL